MKKILPKNIAGFIFDKITGTFSGFMIGLSASGLTSYFFETRSLRNLWGLTAKRTLVTKQTYGALEWIIAALVGYLVFEVFMKLMKNRMANAMLKRKAFRWLICNNVHPYFKHPRRMLFLVQKSRTR